MRNKHKKRGQKDQLPESEIEGEEGEILEEKERKADERS